MLRISTTKRCGVLLTFLFCSVGAPLSAGIIQENTDPTDSWGPLRLLVGSWKGSIDGMLGTGSGIREYELILRDNFLLSKHSSVRSPQEKSPRGDQHEEMGIFSFDKEGVVVALKAEIPKEKPAIDSITDVTNGSNFIEREIHDLFGIDFRGHPELKKLVLPDDWPKGKYPLRKGE